MKKTILITGATGLLGKSLLNRINRDEYDIIIAGRKKPESIHPSDKWVYFDLAGRDSFSEIKHADIIFHLGSATKKFDRNSDVNGTRRLIEAFRNKGLKHFIYISIVGIDKVPISYYKIKLETEQVIINSDIPYTILRATQFHEFFLE